MPRRQEQEDARKEVVEVEPNIVRMELPIRMPGLGHVNCYAIVDRDGAAVVDPGSRQRKRAGADLLLQEK